MTFSIAFIFGLLIPFTAARAEISDAEWTEKGNGGDIIVCPDSSKNLMYDSFEAAVRHRYPIIWPPYSYPDPIDNENYTGFEDLDETIKLATVIVARIKVKNPIIYEKIKTTLDGFKDRVRFVANTDLIDIEDMGLAFIPQGCKIKQLVIQRPPMFPTDRLYTVALDYWKTLNIQQKAVAIIHEVLYTTALRTQQRTSSESVRYFNALLLGDKIKDMSTNEFMNIYHMVFGPGSYQ